jgi:hypothetical protein
MASWGVRFETKGGRINRVKGHGSVASRAAILTGGGGQMMRTLLGQMERAGTRIQPARRCYYNTRASTYGEEITLSFVRPQPRIRGRSHTARSGSRGSDTSCPAIHTSPPRICCRGAGQWEGIPAHFWRIAQSVE